MTMVFKQLLSVLRGHRSFQHKTPNENVKIQVPRQQFWNNSTYTSPTIGFDISFTTTTKNLSHAHLLIWFPCVTRYLFGLSKVLKSPVMCEPLKLPCELLRPCHHDFDLLPMSLPPDIDVNNIFGFPHVLGLLFFGGFLFQCFIGLWPMS